MTYAKAVELAQSLEAADKNVKLLRSSKRDQDLINVSQDVHRVGLPGKQKRNVNSPITCFRCGTSGHIASKCRFSKDIVCHQ